LGGGGCGFGVGGWGPNPKSPIPNPQSPIPTEYFIIKKENSNKYLLNKK